jgi:hypothetical protein
VGKVCLFPIVRPIVANPIVNLPPGNFKRLAEFFFFAARCCRGENRPEKSAGKFRPAFAGANNLTKRSFHATLAGT